MNALERTAVPATIAANVGTVDTDSTDRTQPVLSVTELTTEFYGADGRVLAVDGVSCDAYPGETVCIVGESGCGKTATLMSILGLISPQVGVVRNGSVLLDGRELTSMRPDQLQRLRGKEISLIAQDASSALNPLHRVGDQLRAVIRAHSTEGRAGAGRRTVELLAKVGVPDPAVRERQYPHEFSGGMLQRAMIAMAIANGPKVLLADEPTTALDVTIQAQILELLKKMQSDIGTAIVLVTHDLGVVAEIADRVVVMYAGRVVENGPVRSVFEMPRHPYTAALLASLPSGQTRGTHLKTIPGQPPSLARRPSGCAFHPRCTLSAGRAKCSTEVPLLKEVGGGAASACHFARELQGEAVSVALSASPAEERAR